MSIKISILSLIFFYNKPFSPQESFQSIFKIVFFTHWFVILFVNRVTKKVLNCTSVFLTVFELNKELSSLGMHVLLREDPQKLR